LQLRMPVTGGSWNASAHKGTFKLAGGYFWESGNSSALYATDHWRAGLGTPQGWAVSHLGTVVANFFLTDQISVKLTNHRKTIHVTLDLFYNDTGGTALTAAGINLPPNLIGMLFGHVSLVAKVK